MNDQSLLLGDAEKLRWFLLPSEAQSFIRGETADCYPKVPPFTPIRRSYLGNNITSVPQNKLDCSANVEGNPISFKDLVNNMQKTQIKNNKDSETNQTVYSSDEGLSNDRIDENKLIMKNISDGQISLREFEGISATYNTDETTLPTKNLCHTTLEKKSRETPSFSKSKNGQTIVKQEWKVKFHNPPRHVFNLVVKVMYIFLYESSFVVCKINI